MTKAELANCRFFMCELIHQVADELRSKKGHGGTSLFEEICNFGVDGANQLSTEHEDRILAQTFKSFVERYNRDTRISYDG